MADRIELATLNFEHPADCSGCPACSYEAAEALYLMSKVRPGCEPRDRDRLLALLRGGVSSSRTAGAQDPRIDAVMAALEPAFQRIEHELARTLTPHIIHAATRSYERTRRVIRKLGYRRASNIDDRKDQ